MNSFPWDSIVSRLDDDGYPVYDRTYRAEDLREVYSTFFSNGVFDGDPAPFVVTPGSGMNVTVSPGKCHINGAVGYELSTRSVAITAASSQPRIDTVVLRWDSRRDYRLIDLYVIKGTAADTPTRPALTRTNDIWELGIADIYVAQGTSTITAARITDTRLQTARCGLVTPFAKFDTTGLFNQIQSAIADNIAELERQTQVAVDLAQGAIDGTVAGDLANKVSLLESNKVDRSGDTMTGTLVIDSSDKYSDFKIRRNYADTTKSNVCVMATNDTMTVLSRRANDNVTVKNEMQLTNTNTIFTKPVTLASGGTGASDAQNACYNLINGRIIKPQTIELGTNINNNSGGFIDFHYNGSTADYTSRIIESVSGTISVNGTPFKSGAGLPIANGGTGATTTEAARQNLLGTDVKNTNLSWSVDSGYLHGTLNYTKKNGVVTIQAFMTRKQGGSISNGLRGTGLTMPAGLRPAVYTRAEFCQTNWVVPTNGSVNHFFQVNTDGTVHVMWSATFSPSAASSAELNMACTLTYNAWN